jgi:antitoxin ParD1/3/4
MPTQPRIITLTDTLDAWVEQRVASGGFLSETEYFRELVRLDQRQSLKAEALRNEELEAILIEEENPPRTNVWESIADRYKKD